MPELKRIEAERQELLKGLKPDSFGQAFSSAFTSALEQNRAARAKLMEIAEEGKFELQMQAQRDFQAMERMKAEIEWDRELWGKQQDALAKERREEQAALVKQAEQEALTEQEKQKQVTIDEALKMLKYAESLKGKEKERWAQAGKAKLEEVGFLDIPKEETGKKKGLLKETLSWWGGRPEAYGRWRHTKKVEGKPLKGGREQAKPEQVKQTEEKTTILGETIPRFKTEEEAEKWFYEKNPPAGTLYRLGDDLRRVIK